MEKGGKRFLSGAYEHSLETNAQRDLPEILNPSLTEPHSENLPSASRPEGQKVDACGKRLITLGPAPVTCVALNRR